MTRQRTHPLAVIAAVMIAALATITASPAAAGPGRLDGQLAVADGTGQIYTLNPDGSQLRQLTHEPSGLTATDPDWSPDAQRIAFTRVTDTFVNEIWTVAASGGDERPILTDQPGYSDNLPKYLPGGRGVVFVRCAPGEDAGCSISTVRLDGTHLRTLTPFRHDAIDFWPAVSAAGDRIAFVRFEAGGIQAQVYVMNADGTHVKAITDPALLASVPAWSPDGRRVLFGSNCCRLGGNVYTITPSGRHQDQLTHTPYPLFSGPGAYSPTGTRIAFVSNRTHPDRCCTDLYLMSAHGAAQAPVPTGALHDIRRVAWGSASSR